MIVCVCHAVSDRVIRASITSGASSVKEVGRACRAGTCCGTCRPMIAQLVREHTPRVDATPPECGANAESTAA